MSLELPEIDNRQFDELFAEALARIPVHNPEWTNYNDADAGITILQLFSFMTENLLYRSRQIPERNRLKFLNLLGIEREPANPAVGVVAFENLRGRLAAEVLEADEEVLAGKIPFRTNNGLAVLPLEARAYVKKTATPTGDELTDIQEEAELAYASYLDPDKVEPVYYETTLVEWPVEGGDPVDLADSADRALWLALLARSAADVTATRGEIANRVLTLGVVPDLAASQKVLPSGGSDDVRAVSSLEYRLPNTKTPLADEPEDRVATYVPIRATSDADVLDEPGIVQLQLPGKDDLSLWELDPTEAGVGNFPPSLEGDDAERLITWIRIRPGASDSTAPEPPAAGAATATSEEDGEADQAAVRLSWVGINAALVEQRTRAVKEPLGKGTGRPHQRYVLANTPVLLASVELSVGGVPWERVTDLMTAGPEVPNGAAGGGLAETLAAARKYTVDRESGTVRFGDGIHGARPAPGQLIEVSYDYGGGRAGLVAAGAIKKGPALPAGVKVANPLATWGASEAESVAEAERRIPQFLRHRDRLVTESDFEEIALRTPGVDMGRVEVLPLVLPDSSDVRIPGVVTVMVIPEYDELRPDAPSPDQFFLDAVCRHLDPRRLLTTEIHLRGPKYVSIWLSIGIDVMPGRDIAPVREAVQAAVKAHYSPLVGGIAGDGWPLSTSVERLDAWAVAARVDGVAKVFDVKLTDTTGNERERIEMAGLQLPRLVGLAVQQGDPLPLADLRGEAVPAEPAAPGDKTALPIPITPSEC